MINVREPIGLSFIIFCSLCDFTLIRKFDKFTAELHPIPVSDKVWDTIGVDLIGPLPKTIVEATK